MGHRKRFVGIDWKRGQANGKIKESKRRYLYNTKSRQNYKIDLVEEILRGLFLCFYQVYGGFLKRRYKREEKSAKRAVPCEKRGFGTEKGENG